MLLAWEFCRRYVGFATVFLVTLAWCGPCGTIHVLGGAGACA
jgi:hypothetical protein